MAVNRGAGEVVIRGHRVPAGRQVAGSWVRVTGGGHRLPVVLLHGLGASAGLNWFGAFEPLARDRLVVAPDLLGHGRTPLRGRFRLADAADAVAGVLEELDTGPCIVAGYSMGGAVAQLLAHRHPDAVAGLVLAATSRDFRGRPADRLRFGACTVLAAGTRLVPALPLSVLATVASGRSGERWWAASELANTTPAAVCSAAESLGRFTSRSWVGDLDVPATVVLTTRDRLVPPNRQAKLAAGLPAARLLPIDGDHLVAGKAPERFAAVLRAAVDDVEHRVAATGAARPSFLRRLRRRERLAS